MEKYLKKCLDSLTAQTFTDWEAICIDDGSTDNCGNILEEYASKDTRFKVIHQKNQGQSVARNKGLDICSGNYIFFLDSDDYLHKQALEIFHSVALKTKAEIVVSNYFIRGSKNERFQAYELDKQSFKVHKKAVKDMLNQRYLSSLVWNKLYKKELLKEKRFLEGISFEDWPFITTLFSEIDFYVSIDNKLYFYNDLDYSTVRSPFTTKKIKDYVSGIYFTYNYYQQANKIKYWRLVQKKRIKQSLKMVLSKVYHAKANKKELIECFFENLELLREKNIFRLQDFSLKSKWRLLKLFMEENK